MPLKYKRWFRPAMVAAPGRFADWGSSSDVYLDQIDGYVASLNSSISTALIWDDAHRLGHIDSWGILEYEEEEANEWGEVSP